MKILSELYLELDKANKDKSELTKNYTKNMEDMDANIKELETNIQSYVSIGDANTYNQLKEATNLLVPLGYRDGIYEIVFILNYGLNKYLQDFKEKLVQTLQYNNKDNDYNNLRLSDLEIQDNSYGGDPTKYTNMVRKGYATNYHPCLGGIGVSKKATNEQLENLLLVVSKLVECHCRVETEHTQYGWDDLYTERVFWDSYVKNFFKLLFPMTNLDKEEIKTKDSMGNVITVITTKY